MKNLITQTARFLLPAMALLWASETAYGQFFPGGQAGGTRSRSSSASTRAYPNNSTVGDALISVDPDSRSLIVIADEDTSKYISQVVSNLDRPKPQVLIKVVFMEVTHTKGSDIGIEGGWRKEIDGTTTGVFGNSFGMSGIGSAISSNTPVNALGQPVQFFNPNPPGAGLYQVLGQDYQVTLRAIAQAGNARVLSRPSILARNSQPATILVGQTVPLITSVRYDTLGNAINGITYQDVGIILRVTPFITSKDMVEMIVTPEISTVSQTERVQIQAGAFAPVIDKRSADTVVVTPNGQTVVIGGLMQTQKANGESKIPVLGDIPLLGNLFKRRTASDVKTELLIFLTPHIVEAPGELASLSAAEADTAGTPDAFTEKELNRFLKEFPRAEQPANPPAQDNRPRRRN